MSIRIFKPSGKARDGLMATLSLSSDPISASLQLEEGFDTSFLDQIVQNSRLAQATVVKVVGIDRATLSRHKKSHSKWQGATATKVYNGARVLDAALDLFNQDPQKTEQWLNTPAIALGNVSPSDYAKNPLGQEAVLDLIGRIKHGVIS
ncbi:type II RES/Xre toxin-antitoxin system antitoxin [Marinomonas atlantica]|uniref:type II RES/Xre toxin-antitoxin system antitoxin n=1 Tax=Marinomonas atlantica TaxID=1806668 RepID=UPI0009EE59B6|nr:antitoxin Xre/MbcA/ParS toxin-binding domain-containing protein [Marinomonas atlantica]